MRRLGEALVFSFLLVSWVDGHGRLIKPPARSSLWRLGYDTPINYNDHQLFCGGRAHQISMGGKCGICGDPYDEPTPRNNEIGGPVYHGYITAQYRTGTVIDVEVTITANHRGFIQFKICPVPGFKTEATQQCLDRHVLTVAGSGRTELPISPRDRHVQVRLQLPHELSCEHCVLQWRYHAGNSWGRCEDGSHATGCGPQEEFYGCADVAIGDVSRDVTGPNGRRPTPAAVVPQAGSVLSRGGRPKARHPSRTAASATCVSVGQLSRVPGMDSWCQLNCHHTPAHCPPELCRC